MRIIWIYGPPAVGKSATAWEVLNLVGSADPSVAYVDIDQLGMCYPDPDDDPVGHGLKATALAKLASVVAARGITTLVVSGVVDIEHFGMYEALAGLQPAFVRLAVHRDELRRRLIDRGGAEDWEEIAAEADLYDAAPASHPVVMADDGPPEAVAAAVLSALAQYTEPRDGSPAPALPQVPENPPGEAVLVTGARAVGKSSVGWQLFRQSLDADVPTAFVDLRQLAFVGAGGEASSHDLRAAVLGAVWPVFQRHGARILVANGEVTASGEVALYRSALGATPLRVVRLTADETSLRNRIRARLAGHGVRLAGDDLIGRPEGEVEGIVARAMAEQARVSLGDAVTVDTSDLEPAEVAAMLLADES